MRIDLVTKSIGVAITLVVLGFAARGADPDPPADNLQILREKIRADKKLLVAANMELTESEAKGFWPIYDEYQKDLHKINLQIADLLEGYAEDLRGGTLTDDDAKELVNDTLSIGQSEADLKSRYAPRLSKVLPARKVARYLQIENKIRAVINYDLVTGVPLVE